MRKNHFSILIAIILGLLIVSCGSQGPKPAENSAVDSTGMSPEEGAATVDTAAPMIDTGMSLTPVRSEEQESNKKKEPNKQTDKTRNIKATQQ